MLSPKEIDKVCYEVTSLFEGVETACIESIVKRLIRGKGISSAGAWRLEKLAEVNGLRKELAWEVRKNFRISEKDLNDLIEKALKRANNNDLSKFEGLKKNKSDKEHFDDMKNSEALNRIVKNSVRACKNALNVTGTRAIEASERAYTDAVNKAYYKIASGTDTIKAAVRDCVKEIGESSIRILDRAGEKRTTYKGYGGKIVSYPLDSAVRRDVVTQLNKSAGELTLENCNELECDLVETTWHLGARHVDNPPHPWSNHDEWQGKIFSISGKSDKYPPFKESTGYGEVDGLCGINCRHSFSPYFEEIGPADHREFPSKEENERHYNEQQKQRYYERNIRQLKREQIAYRAGGYDAEARETQARLNAVTAKYNEFLNETGRTPITALTEISGYHYIKAAESVEFVSGALSDKNDPLWVRRDEDAKKFYTSIRNGKKDVIVDKISQNSGFTKKDVGTIINHVFFEKHEIDGKIRLFDESFEMGQSFRRLISGKDIKKIDIILLNHELAEANYMKQGMPFNEAHKAAERLYDYAETVHKLERGEISWQDLESYR